MSAVHITETDSPQPSLLLSSPPFPALHERNSVVWEGEMGGWRALFTRFRFRFVYFTFYVDFSLLEMFLQGGWGQGIRCWRRGVVS
jgi:hypothetical protein